MATLIKKIINDFYKLGTLDRAAIGATMVVVVIFLISLFKQGIETFRLAGTSGSLMPFLHHSRWGAIIAIIGSFFVLKYKKGTMELIGILLIIIGLTLLIQHLATEQCFAIFTSSGRYAGGFC